MAIVALAGCKDEEWPNGSGVQIVEGVPVNLSLRFTTTAQTVKTRVVQKPETEYNVENLYLFVFNGDGSLEWKGTPEITGGDYTDGASEGTVTLPEGTVTSGRNKKIYAIANIDPEGGEGSDIQTSSLGKVEKEADLFTLTARLNDPLQLNRLSFLMTGGLASEDENKEIPSVDIASDGKIYKSGDSTPLKEPAIYLHRIDARITFQIEVGEIKDDDGEVDQESVEFTPRYYKVYKLPGMSNLFPGGTEPKKGYASMAENSNAPFDSREKDNLYFNFYMFENNCKVPEEDSEHYIDDSKNPDKKANYLYLLREKEKKNETDDGHNYEPAQYVYAPDTATYVMIRGDLSYQRKKKDDGTVQYVDADVTYTIHLGETGKTVEDYNDPEKVNNYVVARNTHYTYKVTIQGVNSIRVEVKDDEEEQPGHEGDVVVSGTQVNRLDSHFGRAVFRLSRENCREKNGLSWTIHTPFDDGIKEAGKANTLKDYKWILFAINSEFGIKSGEGVTIDDAQVNMVKFPGYFAYDGGAHTTRTSGDDTNNDIGNSPDNVLKRGKWKEHMPSDNYYSNYKSHISENACLRDVNQLLNYLREEANKDKSEIFVKEEDGGEYVYITAFIDEYVYRYDPEREEYISPDIPFGRKDFENDSDAARRKLLWKKTTNKEPRTMSICLESPRYSQDGSSSWTESLVSFSQYPVYSIYNEQASDEELKTAWGTERIIEGEALVVPPTKDPKYVTSFTSEGKACEFTTYNGRINTLMFYVDENGQSNGKKWGEILNRTDKLLNNPKGEELKEGYRDIWHACLMRNRDLDGDNIIEPQEIRWFLASIDELSDLWVGEDALPDAAKLYQEDGTVRRHVASSSPYNNNNDPNNPWVIWAEEGASRGNYSYSINYNGKSAAGDGSSDKYYYRCIRFLGISLDSITKMPADYVVQVEDKNDSNKGKLYFRNLNQRVTRDAMDNGRELPDHFERGNDDVNKPYRVGFEYDLNPKPAIEDSVMNWELFSANLNYNGESRICPKGWRTPNQRELMLMLTSIKNWTSGYFWSSTRFSFDGNALYEKEDGNRPGFATRADNHLTLVRTNWTTPGAPPHDAVTEGKVRCIRDISSSE